MAEQSGTNRSGALWWAVAGGILLAAAFVRVEAAGSDLWLDEVWSLSLAEQLSSPLDVFSSLRATNNHVLNTLWLAFLGSDASPFAMRALSLGFGIGSVGLAGALGSLNSPREGLFAMATMSASYLMIDASAEARGYAPMVFFVLLALLALELDQARFLRGKARSPRLGALFAASVVLGTLFQISFIIAYAALSLGWIVQRSLKPQSGAQWLREGIVWHGLPLLFYVGLYAFWVRHLSIGGDVFSMLRILERTGMLAVGLDGSTRMLQIGSVIAIVFLLAGLAIVARRRIDRAALYATGIVASPAMVLIWMEPSFLAPRYFLPSLALFLLLVATTLSALFARGKAGAAMATVLLALFLVGNARTSAPLLHEGRGDFTKALEIMDRESPAGPLEIGVRFHFRHSLLLDYYANRLPLGRTIQFVSQEDWPARGTDWMILGVRTEAESIPPIIRGPEGNVYRRVAGFGGLAGREPPWFLYRAQRGPVPSGPG